MTKPQSRVTKRAVRKLSHAITYLLNTRKYANRQEHYNGSLAALELARLVGKL